MPKLRIAYVINHVAFFVSHRLPLATAARDAGHEVILFTGQPASHIMENVAVTKLAATGIPHRQAIFRSSGTNPIIEIIGILQLIFYLLKFKPYIIHCASPKGVLYGGIAARICQVPGLVLAISGMGYIYTKSGKLNFSRRLFKQIYTTLAHFAFNHRNMRVIVQNKDDLDFIHGAGFANQSQSILIPGSGVDLSLFSDIGIKDKSKIILFPARMLRDKGIEEFVAAAQKVKRVEPTWCFILAGAADYDNPTAILEYTLHNWQKAGIVEWLGHVDDMVSLYRKASIVCLPSYREGMPKALLEAAAASCAVVTTDTTGCRDAIEANVTGDLVPTHDSDKLATTILALIRDDDRRKRYGINGRKRAIDFFSIGSVTDKTLEIYSELLSHK